MIIDLFVCGVKVEMKIMKKAPATRRKEICEIPAGA